MLEREWLKVQSITRIKVCGDGFRITVDQNSFDATRANGFHRLHATTIKFHTLPNAIRTRSKDNRFRTVGGFGVAVIFPGAIEIRSLCNKLTRTRIDPLEGRMNTVMMS